MCTILTIGRDFWLENKTATVSRILQDARLNPDGWAIVGVDPEGSDADFNLQSMRIAPALDLMERFFLECSAYGRVFLHSRFATTSRVGVAYNHGFTDHDGTIIMHNGIVDNYRSLAVDSFNLIDYPMKDATILLDMLKDDEERFANLLLIRPSRRSYGVVRLIGGQLHTDGQGNYSSYPIGSINIPVLHHTAFEHILGPEKFRPANKFDDLMEYNSMYDDLDSDEAWKKWVEEKEFKKSS